LPILPPPTLSPLTRKVTVAEVPRFSGSSITVSISIFILPVEQARHLPQQNEEALSGWNKGESYPSPRFRQSLDSPFKARKASPETETWDKSEGQESPAPEENTTKQFKLDPRPKSNVVPKGDQIALRASSQQSRTTTERRSEGNPIQTQLNPNPKLNVSPYTALIAD
jgi:hypothetical protein